mgnify:FL=1
MPATLLGFTLVLTRTSTFLLVLPVFGWKTVPVNIKSAMAVLLAVFFSSRVPPMDAFSEASTLEVILLAASEGVYGLALGFIVMLLFSVVRISGHIIEQQMGLSMARVIDPLTGNRASPLSSLLEMIFVLLFLSANGHHLFLLILSRSYEAFPPGTMPAVSTLSAAVIETGSVMFIACLRLAAPMLAAFLILMVTLALLARLVPEMNILFLSLPLRVGLGLVMAVTFLPLISSFTTEMADWMGKLLPL